MIKTDKPEYNTKLFRTFGSLNKKSNTKSEKDSLSP